MTEYDYPSQPVDFHQRILDAIVNKDLDGAEALLREHIVDAQERALNSLEVSDEKTD